MADSNYPKAVVGNKQVIFRDFVSDFPKELGMYVTTGTVKLKLPQGCRGVLLKNLYLSYDTYMRILMKPHNGGSGDVFNPYALGYVSSLSLLLN
ncbi:hypothetical protein SLA2020_193890 [Shorea laevis]